MEFQGFPKIARLSRNMVITEKIDGTNAQVSIVQMGEDFDDTDCIAKKDGLAMFAGSRSRWIVPEKGRDNHGFAQWVDDHSSELFELGLGTHFGEWWGAGIQRGYGENGKHWSLFNTGRWLEHYDNAKLLCPKCCGVVPVLGSLIFDTEQINNIMEYLKVDGSFAAPGFMKPEGIVIYHEAARVMFKKTFENDEKGKGE